MLKSLCCRGICLYNLCVETVQKLPDWAIVILARLGIAGIFWRSGQTKVDGWLITEQTIFLFEEEYQVPLIPPDIAAYAATTAEHVFPVLLILGLATRLSALSLLIMTLVIQLFVYPHIWPDHAIWAAGLILIIVKGAGPLSFDVFLSRWCRPQT